MAISSAPLTLPRADKDAEDGQNPQKVGVRIKEQLLRRNTRRLLACGASNVPHVEHVRPQEPLIREVAWSSISQLPRPGSARHGKMVSSSLFRRYDAFPKTRYQILQPFRDDDDNGSTLQGCPHALNNKRSERAARKAAPFVAFDKLDKQHVLLTVVPKASASVWQIDHVQRLMATLARCRGFQRLCDVWEIVGDEGNATGPSWVFVQDFQLNWIPLDLYCDRKEFTENTLRYVTFDVVSMVHFLHTHQLSASGQMCANQDFMVNVETQRVVWLVSPVLVLSGCLLARATPGRCSRDISSIGYLMFHLSMVPHAAVLLGSASEDDGFEKTILENLGHLSPPCRAMMLACLVETPAIVDVVKRKWLRHIEFVSFLPRGDHHGIIPHQPKRLVLHTLFWKLATFFLIDWVGSMHALGATSSAIASVAHDEEDMESTRRGKKASGKRQYAGRHVSVSAHHYSHHHHQSAGGRAGLAGGNMIMRGMVIVPPLGSAIMPHSDSDVDEKYNNGTPADIRPRSFILRGSESALYSEDAIFDLSAQATNDHKTPYDSFGYDFPVSPLLAPSMPEYDTFDDLDDGVFAVERSAVGEELLEDCHSIRSRASSLLVHENGHNQSMHSMPSISDLRSVMRSLDAPNQSDEREELHRFDSTIQARAFSREGLDPVHLSAFGPGDIAHRDTFRVDVWAYLRQQRQEMLETALELNESEVAQRVQPMHIARGTLITVSVESNDRFAVVGEECKSFRWRGEVNGVSFDMRHKKPKWRECECDADEDLCIARVVAGTKVSLLFIRLRSTNHASSNSSSPTRLSTHLEHVVANVPDIPSLSLVPVRPIGKGAFGEAMLALWKERNINVVIKSPHRDAFQADTESLDDFRHEAAVMQMLGKHPHVVELLGVTTSSTGVSDDISAIVTEYLPNGSLHDFLTTSDASRTPTQAASTDSTSPLSLFSRTVMARDAAHGIVNIHQGHVLHRDIAARNCLLDDHFRVKVCDFGMSRLASKANCLFFDDEHHGFGPIKWMAPESVLPPHLFSTHSDAYMYGVLMYEIFSGELPFPGISSREAMALILEGHHVTIPDYLPRTHQQLMKSCFDPHPLARPTMDQIFMTLDQWILNDTRHHSRVPVGIL